MKESCSLDARALVNEFFVECRPPKLEDSLDRSFRYCFTREGDREVSCFVSN